MTNPSLSWIDRDQWAALLASADLADRGQAGVAPLAAIERRARARRLPPAVPGVPAAPPAEWEAPPGTLAERLAALTAWAAELTHADSVFVSDDGGLPVFTPQEDCPYLWVSANLLSLLKSARVLIDTLPEGGVHLSLHGGRRLYFVEATTPAGLFGLGLVSSDLLAEARLEQLRAALRRAFAGE